MKVLAIDTSCNVATAALIEDEKLIGEYILNHKKTHSQKIMPMIEQMLSDCECDINEVDLFAVANGPGSFTGLRIGVATIKGLAHATNKPCVGISTLEAMAYNLPYCEHLIVPIMDARRGQVYTGTYMWDEDGFKEIEEPSAISIDECVECCGDFLEAVFIGDGVNVHRQYIKDKMGEKAIFIPANANMPRASSVASLALQKKEKWVSYNELLPVYLRKSQAEREYEEKHNK